MNFENLKVLCLQKHPELYEQTIKLLNDQWPRSRTARLRSLEQGLKDGLPTSLVLVQKELNGKKTVVAHSKISPVPYQPHLCFVESVVVAPELRGKGLGRLVMEETEKFVKSLGVTTVYLTTYDQQEFYKRLGYDFTNPIVVFGGSLKLAEKADNFSILNCNTTRTSEDQIKITDNITSNTNLQDKTLVQPSTCPPPPPPPPPPPALNPMPNISISNNNAITAPKLTMRKLLET